MYVCSQDKPKWFATSIFVCKNSQKIKEYPNIKLNDGCEHKGHFTWTSRNLTFIKMKNFNVMQSLHWSDNHWLESTPHTSFQHNKNITTSHFDILLYILNIIKL